MKISELIEYLQAQLSEHGDVGVMVDAGLLLATGRIVINPVWRCVAE